MKISILTSQLRKDCKHVIMIGLDICPSNCKQSTAAHIYKKMF